MGGDLSAGPSLRDAQRRLQDALRFAVEHHNAGRLDQAEDIYREILDIEPENPSALHLLGVIAHQVGESEAAWPLIQQATKVAPNYAEAHADLGLVFNALGRVEEAIASYRQAVSVKPGNAAAHNNLGNALFAIGDFDKAIESYESAIAHHPGYAKAHSSLGLVLHRLARSEEAIAHCREAVDLDPTNPDTLCNLGLALQGNCELDKAIDCFKKALALDPENPEVLNNLGNVLQETERFDEAVSRYREALTHAPDYADARKNMGNALHAMERYEEAIEVIEQLIAADPRNPDAHNDLGLVEQDLSRFDRAAAHFEQALAIEPGYANAPSNLALVKTALGEPEEAVAHFDTYLQMMRGPDADTSDSELFRFVSKAKISHDIEQYRYLAQQGNNRFDELAEIFETLRDDIDWPEGDEFRVRLSEAQFGRVADCYNRPLSRVDAPKIDGSTVNGSLDTASITRDYFENAPGMTYFDDALTDETLALLRRYLLESTIWFDTKHREGYLGAMLNDGLACPLVLQIAEDFRQALPEVFRDHRLLQCWAFKYDSSLNGIEVHADAAAVNVNFWVTPDAANLSPESGGLVVYKAEAPLDWRFTDYNADQTRIRQFLAENDSGKMVVPHRQNRVVLFNSDLFHETDRFTFKPGYENRRINVTMLFGRRQDG
ncbi:MAG: tetratricopeptide repeat protein [Rhodospirillaceae bacterium]|nr:tetratricopeptide repeat protein [Rhodospirillaceae bacterium]